MGKKLPLWEFTILVAVLFSMIGLATDAMLPSLAQIGKSLDVTDSNKPQLIITVFLLGTGLGQLIMGPLSDAFGRKAIIALGLIIFILSSLYAANCTSFQSLLVARFIQGIGLSAPRTGITAMVRDLYVGRMMARVVSLAMMVFALVPAIAPLLGQWIAETYGWPAIFVFLGLISLLPLVWMVFRQAETLPKEKRRPFSIAAIYSAFKQATTNRRVIISTIGLSFGYACLFAYLSAAQQIFVVWLDTGHDFPKYFAIIALIAGVASLLNALLVVRIGMWMLISISFGGLAVVSLVIGAAIHYGLITGSGVLIAVMVWSILLFVGITFCFANLNSMALEPMGHIAGTIAAIVGAVSTNLAILMAIPLAGLFDGTGTTVIIAMGGLCAVAFLVNLTNPRKV